MQRLRRSRRSRLIAGVCGGIGERYGYPHLHPPLGSDCCHSSWVFWCPSGPYCCTLWAGSSYLTGKRTAILDPPYEHLRRRRSQLRAARRLTHSRPMQLGRPAGKRRGCGTPTRGRGMRGIAVPCIGSLHERSPSIPKAVINDVHWRTNPVTIARRP